jgi:hypothetical protein
MKVESPKSKEEFKSQNSFKSENKEEEIEEIHQHNHYDTNININNYNSNTFSQISKISLPEMKAPSPKAREIYVEMIKFMEADPSWSNKKKCPHVEIKFFENDVKNINKFKFEIRKKLDKENLLIMVHSKQTLLKFYSTLQLSEKIEPESLWGFLKTSGIFVKKNESKLYKSKNELKGKEKSSDSLKKQVKTLINAYYLETWKDKNKEKLNDLVYEKIESKLKKIDEVSNTYEALEKIENDSVFPEESKGIDIEEND